MTREFALLACLTTLLVAQPAPVQSQEAGRYTMVPSGNGIVRLDSQTGAVSICGERFSRWVCQSVADDALALQREIDRLTEENARLKKSGNGNVSGDQADLQQKIEKLAEENRALREKAAANTAAARTKMQKQVTRLTRQNKELEASTAAQRKEMQREAERLSEENRRLKTEAKADRANWQREVERLTEENRGLREEAAKTAAADRARVQQEIEQLTEEIRLFKETIGDLQKAPVKTAASTGETAGQDGPAVSAGQDVDRVTVFFERMMQRFRDMAESLRDKPGESGL